MASRVKKDGESNDDGGGKAIAFQDADHRVVVEQFEEYADGTIEIRKLAARCRDYKDGNHWTDAERQTLKKRKQPCITDNKVQDKVNTLLGIEKRQRTDPKAFPRNPSQEDEQSAEAATDALRFVADENCYKTNTRKPAAENLIVEGICYGQVIVEKRKGKEAYICMEHIRQDRGYYDLHSLKDDFSDKRYCGYFTWMDYDEAIENEKWDKGALEASVSGESQSGPDKSLDDKPRWKMTKGTRKRVQIFKHYRIKSGVWHESVWCRGGWLEKEKSCTYKDKYGEPACCMEIQALYRDSDGAPYGEVPRYLDLQDEHNKRRSKMLHLLNAKRIIVGAGMVSDEDGGIQRLRDEAHKPDGVMVLNGDVSQLKVEDNLREAEGQWRLLQQTDVALSQTGPNAALAGLSGDISGVAKARDQVAGELPISPLFDSLDAWELRMYRQVWCRVRQFWDGEMWIRVTDDEQKVRWVGLNQPITQGDMAAQAAAQNPEFQQMPDEEKRAIIMQLAQRAEAQQQMLDDKTGRPMRKNDVATMDVDIIIERGMDTVTVQQEEFAQLVEIAKGRPEIPFDTLVEMSQLRATTKKRVLDKLTGANDPMAEQRAQMQQMIDQLNAALLEAKVRRENAAAGKDEAASVESQVDASVKVATFTTPQPVADGAAGNAAGNATAGKGTVSVN
jgi:hypothetical protein